MMKRWINIGVLYGVGENIRLKVGDDLKEIGMLKNAYLEVEDGLIVNYGTMSSLTNSLSTDIDLKEKCVIPGFIDCHTHLVFGTDRKGEFLDRLSGLSYQEIANRGGGILNSAKQIKNLSENELLVLAKRRLNRVISQGTTAIEIKSGYGLSVEGEIKLLRVIKQLKEWSDIPIKATFLGAHALPKEFSNNKSGYIDCIINEMLPIVKKENLADYIDVFCEKGYFDVSDTERVLKAGVAHGLIPRIHVNQFYSIGGVKVADTYNAISVDHLEVLEESDVEVLSKSKMIAVGLPACSLFLGIPYTPMRKLIKSGVAVALATDFNPGSSPTGNMRFVLSLACVKMKMTPIEALNACTINAAYSLNLQDSVGSFTKGKIANFSVLENDADITSLAYYMADDQIDDVFVKGISSKSGL